MDGNYYYYRRDHLGNNREVVKFPSFGGAGVVGELVQVTNYYPSGLPWKYETEQVQPYLYNGKEFVEMGGLDTYDYGARGYYAAIGRFTTIDPLAEKYYNISPYAYVKNRFMTHIDPDGRKVVGENEQARENIKKTLTPKEAKSVRFDKNGTLDTKRLNKSKSTSDNMTALKTLANSERTYSFKVADKNHAGQEYHETSPTNFLRGTTEMPGHPNNPSPDDKVYIFVGECLSEQQQVKTTAHEAYGHAYFFELTGDVEKSSHTYDLEFNAFTNKEGDLEIIQVQVPTNTPLENQIDKVVKQAEDNYDERKK